MSFEALGTLRRRLRGPDPALSSTQRRRPTQLTEAPKHPFGALTVFVKKCRHPALACATRQEGGEAGKWTLWHLDGYSHSQRINMRIPKSYKNEIYFSLICCFKPLKRWVSVLQRGKYSGH